jgi:hypothetical protein
MWNFSGRAALLFVLPLMLAPSGAAPAASAHVLPKSKAMRVAERFERDVVTRLERGGDHWLGVVEKCSRRSAHVVDCRATTVNMTYDVFCHDVIRVKYSSARSARVRMSLPERLRCEYVDDAPDPGNGFDLDVSPL